MQAAQIILYRFKVYIIDPIILLIFSIGFLYFMWGLVMFMMNVENSEKRAQGKRHMIWGIIGMLIMISVWGILALLDNTFNLGALSGQIDIDRINNVTPSPPF